MKKGQTLLEVIIATAIIVFGLVPLLSLVVQSMSVGQESKERTQATFLAQESIETIQNIRDSNFKNERYWLENIAGFLGFNQGYYTYEGFCCPPQLTYLGQEKKHDGINWDINPRLDGINFYRYIELKKYQDSDDKIEVNVEVTWPREYNNNPDGKVNLSSIITSWLPNEN